MDDAENNPFGTGRASRFVFGMGKASDFRKALWHVGM